MAKYHQNRACVDCPFSRKNKNIILEEDRIIDIMESTSFTCHKKRELQCAGHMLLNKMNNEFYRLSKIMRVELNLKGQEDIFESHQECLEYHIENNY